MTEDLISKTDWAFTWTLSYQMREPKSQIYGILNYGYMQDRILILLRDGSRSVGHYYNTYFDDRIAARPIVQWGDVIIVHPKKPLERLKETLRPRLDGRRRR